MFDPPRVVQEELQYFFKDAGTKLVLMSGNTNAEQAAQSLSIPALNVKFGTHFGPSGPSGIPSTRQTALRAMYHEYVCTHVVEPPLVLCLQLLQKPCSMIMDLFYSALKMLVPPRNCHTKSHDHERRIDIHVSNLISLKTSIQPSRYCYSNLDHLIQATQDWYLSILLYQLFVLLYKILKTVQMYAGQCHLELQHTDSISSADDHEPVEVAAVFTASQATLDPLKHQLEDGPHENDVALLLHTSGTTSTPKAVPLTHSNLTASLANTITTYEMQPSDRSLLVMPLFHVHGLMAGG